MMYMLERIQLIEYIAKLKMMSYERMRKEWQGSHPNCDTKPLWQ